MKIRGTLIIGTWPSFSKLRYPKNSTCFPREKWQIIRWVKNLLLHILLPFFGEQTAINHVWLWDTTWVPSRSQTFNTPSLRHWIRFLAMPRKHFSEIVLEKAQHMAGKGPKKRLKTLEMTGKTIIESRIMCIPEGLAWNGRIGSIDCYSLVSSISYIIWKYKHSQYFICI